MNNRRGRRHSVEHDDVHRWLVSYADYMTLMFALFVVLYAMEMVNEKPFISMTDSIGRVFQADKEEPKNLGQGEGILPVNAIKTEKDLYGNAILDVAGPELVEGDPILSDVESSKVGTNLTSLETELHTALFDLVEMGDAQLKVDGDWLEIELNSGLLFPSGSSSPTLAATQVLAVIYEVIGDVSNFIRVRGYTDNQAINTEFFSSNWELSVVRATAILRELEKLDLNPARMAIEGYGQYYPNASNNTRLGRAKNRRVVIAVSKYGLKSDTTLTTPSISVQDIDKIQKLADEGEEGTIRVIPLENGGIRITTRNDDSSEENQPQPDGND